MFSCTHCKKSFNKKGNYDRHLFKIHKNDDPLVKLSHDHTSLIRQIMTLIIHIK
jgi:uncharacterized C2H2 Zn-finger protein